MKPKLTAAHSRLIRKAEKTLAGLHDLDDMADNALLMSVLISDLVKVIKKIDTSDRSLQEKLEKLTNENGGLKAENKLLEDGGRRLIVNLKKIEREKGNKKHQYWQDNHHPDVLN